jgi:hypothetical protein
MQPATIEKTQTKVRRASVARAKIAQQQTFKEWLAEEVIAGRIIPPRGTGETPPLPNLSDMPKNFNFQAFYEDCRAERF